MSTCFLGWFVYPPPQPCRHLHVCTYKQKKRQSDPRSNTSFRQATDQRGSHQRQKQKSFHFSLPPLDVRCECGCEFTVPIAVRPLFERHAQERTIFSVIGRRNGKSIVHRRLHSARVGHPRLPVPHSPSWGRELERH